jgi:hypothetical protein
MRWGAMVALAALLGGQARAEEKAKGTGGIEDPARTGQPGATASTPPVSATPLGARQLSGTVVKADDKNVYLEHMGAVIPLKVDENTRFTGEGVKSSRDLTEGQEVRASFTVKGTDNVADRITAERASGKPGADSGKTGADTGRSPPPGAEGLPPGHPPVPRDPGRSPVEPGTPPTPKY